LLAALAEGRDSWPGILGFDDTVIPQLERALIAGHDVVLLGERGQGKDAAVARADRPARRVDAGDRRCRTGRAPVHPDHAPSRSAGPTSSATSCPWRGGTAASGYTEKLATPDTSVADLSATSTDQGGRRRSLGDPETIAYV